MAETAAAPAPAIAAEPVHLDPELTVPRWLRRVCEAHGERPALVFGERTWTYRQLGEDVSRLEATLLELGVTKGTRVALLMGMRPEWVIAALATMSVGAIAVPLSTYEPADKREQLLRHGDAAVVVLQDQMLRHAYLDDLLRAHPGLRDDGAGPLLDPGLPYLRRVIAVGGGGGGGRVLRWDEALAGGGEPPRGYLTSLERELHPTDEALIIYTSGTSGLPKGVVHAHRALAVQFERLPQQFTLRPDDVVWGTYPLFWSAGIGWVLGPTLSIGATLVLAETFDPVAALDLIERHRVTVAHITPTHAAELEEALATHPVDVSSIRIIPRGSLPGHLQLPADRPFGGASLGLTETLTVASSIPWDSPVQLRHTTHGRPLPGVGLRIVDPDTGAELPVGEHGEVALKGTTLMKGYNKAFPETYLDDSGYYRTKDSGYMDEQGYLHWTGRMSEVIRSNNALVSPAEVESALQQLIGVKIAAVVGVADEIYGEAVVACVVPAAGVALTESDLRAQLRERLAGYKVPSRIVLASEDEVPLTGTGKPVLDGVRALVAARMQSRGDGAS